MNQILGWAPSGEGRWYKTYGQAILTCLLAGWAIAMTELELVLNDQTSINNQWGFGQVYRRIYVTKITCAKLFHRLGSTISPNHRPSLLIIRKLPGPSLRRTPRRIHTNRTILNSRRNRASMPLKRTRRTPRRLHKPTLRGSSRSHQGPLPIRRHHHRRAGHLRHLRPAGQAQP